MKTHTSRALGYSVLLGLAGCCARAADPAPLSPADYPKLLAATAAVINAALPANPSAPPTPRTADRVRIAALMLAHAAQQDLAGKDGAQRLAERDAAVQLAKLVKEKDFAGATKLAQTLGKVPPSTAAKREPVKLANLDAELVMSQFRSVRSGGLGLEDRLDELAGSKGAVAAGDLNDDLRLLAYRIALAADLTRLQAPEQKTKDWQTYSDAMRRAAVDLGTAVQAKNGKAAFSAVEALNESCKRCHKDFRK